MSYTEQSRETANGMHAAWTAFTDPTPFLEDMSERMGVGDLPRLFQAIAAMQTEALRIAVHAPFVPFHVYAQIVQIETPLTKMADAAEEAATHVVETMNHNNEVLQQETGKMAEAVIEKAGDAVIAPIQKSASPRAKTASGPTFGSGA